MDGTWTIGELAERAAAALAADGSTQVSGRVRDVPNRRLIRWYTTIGLLDPPAARRGRTALYGPRHLLQLVAVKRRQAAGRSIAEIQTELAGATDATLEHIAALPFPATDPPPHTAPADHRTADSAREPVRRKGPSAPPHLTGPAPAHRPAAPGSPVHPAPALPPNSADRMQETPPPGPAPEPENRPSTSPTTASTTAREPDGPATASDAPTPDPAAREEVPADEGGLMNDAPGAHGLDPAGREREAGRSAFWRARPDISYTDATVADDYGRPDASPEPRATAVQGVRLVPGLTLLLDVPALDGEDLAAIETAARPLLHELRRRGLLTSAESPAFLPADPSRRFP
ncbi:MerR family transcriptional regulator [Actinomadura welshii]